MTAGLLIAWLQLNVSGFRPVLARGWHGHAHWMQTTGASLLAVKQCSPARARTLAQDSRGPHGLLYLACCTEGRA